MSSKMFPLTKYKNTLERHNGLDINGDWVYEVATARFRYKDRENYK